MFACIIYCIFSCLATSTLRTWTYRTYLITLLQNVTGEEEIVLVELVEMSTM